MYVTCQAVEGVLDREVHADHDGRTLCRLQKSTQLVHGADVNA